MLTLSVCLIVRNEEAVLARVLNCVKDFADEIIVVDTGSCDNTKEIAKGFTSNVYDFMWVDDFSKARNFSLSYATKDYIMWIDADDVILASNIEKILNLKQTLSSDVDMVMMKYDVAFDEYDNTVFSYYRERIFRNDSRYKFLGNIHEAVELVGNVIYEDIAICHKKVKPVETGRNLRIFEKMESEKQFFDPRSKFYYARELMYNFKYEKAISMFNNFLSCGGMLENMISACQNLSECYLAVNNKEQALNALFKSFEYDLPHAEICCDIALQFFGNEKYSMAAFWYKQALSASFNPKSGGFYQPSCYDFIPYIQLSVCYDRLGEYDVAKDFNNLAGKIKPYDKSFLHNKDYFEGLCKVKKRG